MYPQFEPAHGNLERGLPGEERRPHGYKTLINIGSVYGVEFWGFENQVT